MFPLLETKGHGVYSLGKSEGFTGLTTTVVFINKKGGDVGNYPAWFQKL